MLELPISSILRGENSQKTSEVFRKKEVTSIWDPSCGYSEQGGIPWSRICRSDVLSVMRIQRPTSLWGTAMSIRRQAAPQQKVSYLFLWRGTSAEYRAVLWSREDRKPQCLLGRVGSTVSLFYMKTDLAKTVADMHHLGGNGPNPQHCTAASAVRQWLNVAVHQCCWHNTAAGSISFDFSLAIFLNDCNVWFCVELSLGDGQCLFSASGRLTLRPIVL